MDKDKISVLLFWIFHFQLHLILSAPNFSFPSRNCLWAHPLYCISVYLTSLLDKNLCVVINNSASSSSHVWCSTGLRVETCTVLYTAPLSDIIANNSVNIRFCRQHPASKINSTSPSLHVQSIACDLQSCTDDIKATLSFIPVTVSRYNVCVHILHIVTFKPLLMCTLCVS